MDASRDTTSELAPRSQDAATPSSPPPSYEHVLAEAEAEARALDGAAAAEQRCQAEVAQDGGGRGGGGGSGVTTPSDKRPEIMHKSSKELYRAVAAEWGITCKMSDHCRCLDCQSRYFDCEYEQNEQDKTDGGLGAGTPMFISEVMHGTACSIL